MVMMNVNFETGNSINHKVGTVGTLNAITPLSNSKLDTGGIIQVGILRIVNAIGYSIVIIRSDGTKIAEYGSSFAILMELRG